MTGVAVVGSANLDVVVFLQRFAGPGETVLGDRLDHVVGGKGLNQAVAAARTGPSAFVGCLGSDEAGDLVRARMERAGVELRHVSTVDEPTGRAFIQVTPDGENSIVVMPLANRSLTPDHVSAALGSLRPAVVLCQLEIPLASVQAAAEWAAEAGARFLLNPSPIAPVPAALLGRCDPLVLNLDEARALLGTAAPEEAGDAVRDALEAAGRLLGTARSAVVTAGAAGAAVATHDEGAVHVPGVPTVPVDTTGAGDEFVGALAAALAVEVPLGEAGRLANEAAARAVALPRAMR